MKLHYHLIAQIISSLRDVFVDRRYADKVVEYAFKRHPKWGSRDRKLFAEAVYEIVRHWRWYWYLAGQPDAEHAQREAITMERLWHVWAAYWVMAEHELPFFDEVGAVRRAYILERAKADVSPALRASIPDWMEKRLGDELGAAWPAIRETLNKPADVYLRVNTLKTERRSLKTRLAQEGFITDGIKEIPTALHLRQRYNVFGMAAFKEGLFEVQDASSQCVAPFLQVEPGMKVVDACAGAGGKTLHLGALMQNKGKIIALDVHDWKLAELRKRTARAGVDVAETRVIEGTKTLKRLAGYADRLLLDVPCSGLGVLRRNPDAKWKLSNEEIDRLIIEQQDILSRYSALVKPGGKMVYATCSILPGENEQQVQKFLSTRGDEWTLEEEMKINPAETGHDGFYAARLVRKKEEPKAAPAIVEEAAVLPPVEPEVSKDDLPAQSD
ncbi:RsmB/NOP family class I SAM-dependent RNA methyltransferase [Prosthecobacter fusiformis]|uniref:RsmB/NOP family class I SAM-dependent RNA methyltransferase n=1 Tax=Prosthecobacter fusiformis TaxID=48464 RepID=UPI00105D52F2|nr:RsmB/NOP family class I SAM-dependent RNA methyltransferase [Prosthecobacter fusiformis]